MVSLATPLATASAGIAATASEAASADSSQVEDATLTDDNGKPTGALSAKAVSPAEKVFSTGKITGEHFSSIGLSWKKESAVDGGLTAETRIQRDGVWGSWRDIPLELDEGVAREAKRGGAPAFYTDDADGVEVRFTSPQERLPQDLRLSFIDPAQSPTAAVSDRQARSTQAGQPEVKLRKDWGANENLADPGYKTQSSIKAALVHHTVTGNNSYTQDQVPLIINGIYVHHITNLGYGDFPYHFIVDRFGGIWEGRKGSVEMRPGTAIPGILGGHAAGFNTNTFGVAMLGNFEPNNSEGGENTGPDPKPTEAMTNSLADLLAWKSGQYQLAPEGSTQLVSAGGGGANPHPVGTVLDVPVISSHRDVNVTTCPGGKLYETLPALREKVAERLG
ncbi:N-acetylmuramoyl-L-alanine amidase [Streptomyces sp. ADI96-02]|uniref:N-acetylmuramoyl-L-alanine amidase n=1 Tax=Streptomyces sp. ADI96-02 TaxID=1522760 RepID=UPI000F54CB5B|nr:N-acetylmuramoyl-L-alanine amidase [Streptomyces sp. ADI96-02]